MSFQLDVGGRDQAGLAPQVDLVVVAADHEQTIVAQRRDRGKRAPLLQGFDDSPPPGCRIASACGCLPTFFLSDDLSSRFGKCLPLGMRS